MTQMMDKFFTKIGLEAEEINKTSIRKPLYFGILFMSALIITFISLTFLT